MVMNRPLRKSIFRDLRQSPGRFIAVFFIIAIGAGFFAGVGCTAPSMLFTGDNYFNETRLADFRLISTMGITDDDVEAIERIDGVNTVMPRYAFNAKLTQDDYASVFAIKSIPKNTDDNPNYLNQLTIIEGRLPIKSGECVVDYKSDVSIGDKFSVTDSIEGGELSMLKTNEIEIVGTVRSPEYISFNRGNTSLGSGEIYAFIYLAEDTFDSEYYTEVNLLLDESIEISAFSDQYKKLIEDMTVVFEEFGLNRADIRMNEIVGDAKDELADAETELADAIIDAEAKFADAEEELTNAAIEAQEELAKAEQELNDAIVKTDKELRDAYNKLEAGRIEHAAGIEEYNKNLAKLQEGEAQLAEAKALLASLPPGVPPEMLPINPEVLRAQIAQSEAELAAGRAALNEALVKLNNAAAEITAGQEQYNQGRIEAEQSFAEARRKIDQGRIDAQTALDEARVEIDNGRIEASEEFAKAQAKIDDAHAEIAAIELPEWMIFTRENNPGYATLEPNADRVETLAMTIPPFMFIIAALVCLTTMTRLVEEQRTIIGTLKALGYSRKTIVSKYMFYSITISLSGSIVGVIVGVLVFPINIWHAYGEMFHLGEFDLFPVPIICAIALLAGVLVTAGVTFASCYSAQKSVAAELMRPKAPKPGKRVLLERVTVVWKRLTFNQKATLRNLFRYKRRLIMTIIGVAGCCALLLGIIGLRDSVTGIADRQYEEISHYNISVLLDENSNREQVDDLLASNGEFTFIHENSGELSKGDIVSDDFSITITVPENIDDFNRFISFLDAEEKNEIVLKDSKEGDPPNIVITNKIAKFLGAKKGDIVRISSFDGEPTDARVIGVAKNYVLNFVYMTPSDYVKAFDKQPSYLTALLKLDDSSEENVDKILAKLIENDNIEYAISIGVIKKNINSISDNLTVIILVIQLMSTILAIIVLYNLIYINITEREREIATLKVLGYKKTEIFTYIFSESLILTIIGSFFGVFVGIGLHRYVIGAIEVDEVTFVTDISPTGYIFAVGFTLVCCLIVNLIMQPKLHKIQPVSSLKSPE